MRFLFKRRYEVLALTLALLCGWIQFHLNSARSTGLVEGEGPLFRAIQLIEARTHDLRFRIRGEQVPHDAVTVVAIDEKSTQRFGLFPWPRARMAKAIEQLVKGKAKAVGLDITFTDQVKDDSDTFRELLKEFDAEPKATELQDFRSRLEVRSQASNDQALANAFESAGPSLVQGVFAYPEAVQREFSDETRAEQRSVLESEVIREIRGPQGTPRSLPVASIVNCAEQYSAQIPLKAFVGRGNRFGYLNFLPDVDGTMRRTPPLIRLSSPSGFLASMPVQTAAAWLDAEIIPRWDVETKYFTGLELKSPHGSVVWPVEELEPYALINHVGPARVFRTVSIAEVIEGTFRPEDIDGKLVLIGVTVTGSTGDQRVTPFREFEPGVYGHASVVSNLLLGNFLSRPNWLTWLEVLLMPLMALGLAQLLPRLRSFGLKAVVIVTAVALWAAVAQILFSHGILVAVVVPLVNLGLSSFGLIFLGYLSVDRESLQLRSTFTRYLGREVMEEALKNPDKLNRGEKREMTVLFSDIRGFTTVSEKMAPEKLAEFMNEYLSPMTRIVFDQQGTLDKYIGDAVMAFWNAPIDQPDHAVRACRAALAMLDELELLRAKWRSQDLPAIDIGVGINTGPMIVGNIGSDVRVDYTVLGDAVNLSSRLEGTNKEYGTRIIIGETTFQQVKDQLVTRRLGAVRVKGKKEPAKIYELRGVGPRSANDAQAIEAFEMGLDAYIHRQWAEALSQFSKVLELWPDDVAASRYRNEIHEFQKDPPDASWDGVFTAVHK